MAELSQRVIDTVGGVDPLVNNGGTTTGATLTLDRSDESWRSELARNRPPRYAGSPTAARRSATSSS